MKSAFSEYYPKDPDSLKKMWEEAVFVFDANVLLGLYKYSSATSGDLLGLMKHLGERIWLPHQVVHEYHKNRPTVIKRERDCVPQAVQALKDSRAKIGKIFADSEGGRFLDSSIAELTVALDAGFSDLEKQVEGLQEKLKDFPEVAGPDHIRDKLEGLFDGKVGAPWSATALLAAYEEGERRIANKIPPGFEDKDNKRPPEVYGDIVAWKQILEFANSDKRPIIFVTVEKKRDWWIVDQKGVPVSPRPELRREMWDEAGVGFHMYRVPEFIKYGKEALGLPISDKALQEVEEVQEAADRADDAAAQMAAFLRSKTPTTTSIPGTFTYTPDFGATLNDIYGNYQDFGRSGLSTVGTFNIEGNSLADMLGVYDGKDLTDVFGVHSGKNFTDGLVIYGNDKLRHWSEEVSGYAVDLAPSISELIGNPSVAKTRPLEVVAQTAKAVPAESGGTDKDSGSISDGEDSNKVEDAAQDSAGVEDK